MHAVAGQAGQPKTPAPEAGLLHVAEAVASLGRASVGERRVAGLTSTAS